MEEITWPLRPVLVDPMYNSHRERICLWWDFLGFLLFQKLLNVSCTLLVGISSVCFTLLSPRSEPSAILFSPQCGPRTTDSKHSFSPFSKHVFE